MPYMDDIAEYHERKKDGTPTDTPHPHRSKRRQALTGFIPGGKKTAIAGSLIAGVGVGALSAVVESRTGIKRRRKRFEEVADALHKFVSSNSKP